MVANNSKGVFHWLAGRFPGQVGHLYSPGKGYKRPVEYLPFALDNGAFVAWKNGAEWDGDEYMRMIESCAKTGMRPRWALVPDVVQDADATARAWREWHPRLRGRGWPLAFAVQDGMVPADVPSGASVVFVGGSVEWKLATMRNWCKAFPRVHVGRVNTLDRLWRCVECGVESVDGTGWFHDDQTRQLRSFLESGQKRPTTIDLFCGGDK